MHYCVLKCLFSRLDNGVGTKFPDHTALSRWPTLNGQPHTMRERTAMAVEENVRERRAKTLRESSFRRQEGLDNPAYDTGTPYYLRLQSETGSTRDFEDRDRESRESRESQESGLSRDRDWALPKQQGRDWALPKQEDRVWALPKQPDGDSYLKNQDRGSGKWDLPKNQWELPKSVDKDRSSKRESSSEDISSGRYRPKPFDPSREMAIPPPPSTGYTEENGIPIPPPDYHQDLLHDLQATAEEFQRPLSLQEAILDRTLRLKKVPEKLRKGLM